jgi:hypothetical protein
MWACLVAVGKKHVRMWAQSRILVLQDGIGPVCRMPLGEEKYQIHDRFYASLCTSIIGDKINCADFRIEVSHSSALNLKTL